MPNTKVIKKKTKNKSSTYKNILQKISYYKLIVKNTILSIQKYKSLDIVSASDLNICVNKLQEIYTNLKNINEIMKTKNKNINTIVQKLQEINNEITVLFQKYGTDSIDNLLSIVFGNNFNQSVNNLPKGLKHVEFESEFNQSIDNLPKELTHIYFGYYSKFNKSINFLPPSLTHLIFGILK